MDFGTLFTASVENMAFGAVFIALLSVLVTYLLYKFIKATWEETKPLDYKKDVKLYGKTVLITGANCGLGKAVALDLATRGARVILACRNQEKAEAAAEDIRRQTGNLEVSVIILDLSDLDSVRTAAENVIKTYDRLDVLINNAGVGLIDQNTTKQGFDMIFGTNYLGHFLFTQLLLDLLKRSAPSRIINVSSNALYAVWKKLNYDPTSEKSEVKYLNLHGYPISKLANYYHVKTLANELKGTQVTANAVHPGYVQTEIMKRDIEDRKKAFLNKIFLFFSKLIGRTGKDGCQTIVYVAVDPELGEVTGEYFANLTQSTDQLPALAKDGEEAEKLSKFGHEMCQDYLSIKPLAAQNTTNEKTDDKKEDEQEEKEQILFQSTEAAFAMYGVEELATIDELTCAENLDGKKEDEPEEKEQILLQTTEAAFVPYEVEKLTTIDESTCSEDLDDKKEDKPEEKKGENLLQSEETAFETYAVEEIATIGASTHAENFEDESCFAPLDKKSKEAFPVEADITLSTNEML